MRKGGIRRDQVHGASESEHWQRRRKRVRGQSDRQSIKGTYTIESIKGTYTIGSISFKSFGRSSSQKSEEANPVGERLVGSLSNETKKGSLVDDVVEETAEEDDGEVHDGLVSTSEEGSKHLREVDGGKLGLRERR